MTGKQTISDFPDVQVCACANLRRASRIVTQAYDAALKPLGLRATQFTMLSVLAMKGAMRQSAFATLLGMDGTTLTRNLQPLLKKGWIQIDREQDQRVRLVSLTRTGRQMADEAAPLWQQVQNRFVKKLGDEQWANLLGALRSTAELSQTD